MFLPSVVVEAGDRGQHSKVDRPVIAWRRDLGLEDGGIDVPPPQRPGLRPGEIRRFEAMQPELRGNPAFLGGGELASARSEERRVGNEGVRQCRSRWSPWHI